MNTNTGIGRSKSIDLLKSLLVQFKQDLEGRTETCRLDLAPKSTLVASNAIHNPRDITEMLLELLLENLKKKNPQTSI